MDQVQVVKPPINRLKEAARERWDECWTVEVRHFADGTTRAHAYSNRGQSADGRRVRERLMPDADGQLHLERIEVIGGEEIVDRDVLESPLK